MTLLDIVRRDAPAPDGPEQAPVSRPVMTRRQFSVLLVILAVLLAGTLALVFGPARGARTDLVSLSDDLDASRGGIFSQLDTAREQLEITEQSLMIQEQGLAVAVDTQRIAQSTSEDTEAARQQTQDVLQTVREVTAALGPLDQLDDKIDTVVRGVEVGVRLAETTLRIAEQTLATGREALAVAKDTLTTLERSEQIQIQLLEVAKQTLEQTREINRKTPGAPVFPTTTTAPAESTR